MPTMPTTHNEREDLQRAIDTGLNGSSNVQPGDSPQLLCQLQVPDCAPRTWLLNLLSMGSVPQNGLQGLPLTNQGLLQARITWGNSKGQESCLIDYPIAGCTVQLNASLVRAQVEFRVPGVVFPPGGLVPLCGATLIPGVRDYAAPPPWWTSLYSQLSIEDAENVIQFYRPARARGFRVYAVHAINNFLWYEAFPAFCFVSQYDNFGGALDTEALVGSGGVMVESQPTNRSQYYPLLPQCTEVRIVNAAGTGVVGDAINFCVQWVLDLS